MLPRLHSALESKIKGYSNTRLISVHAPKIILTDNYELLKQTEMQKSVW